MRFRFHDTNRKMKTNDMPETVGREVVISLTHLTAQHAHAHTPLRSAGEKGERRERKGALFICSLLITFPVSNNQQALNKSDYE